MATPEATVARRKAEHKLGAILPDSVPNAAVLLLFQAKSRESATRGSSNTLRASESAAAGTAARRSGLDFLRRAQTSDGGWGPYADSPPEAFDTALVLLALAEIRNGTGVPPMIQRGRDFLRATQLPDGSWPATTRLSGGQSYAQQMSTTGWATLALLATR